MPRSPSTPASEDTPKDTPETLVKQLYDSLNEKQRKEVCFDWDYVEPARRQGQPRAAADARLEQLAHHQAGDQQRLLHQGSAGDRPRDFRGDDSARVARARSTSSSRTTPAASATQQNIAIFGKPGDDKFEFVMTGRHMTIRCDGNSAEHVAFGGPIFYGHAAVRASTKRPTIPATSSGRRPWRPTRSTRCSTASSASSAVVESRSEEDVKFRGKDTSCDGIPVSELSGDQKEQVQKTLGTLLEPYRQSDQDEVLACLEGAGRTRCAAAWRSTTTRTTAATRSGTTGGWKGPAFVWYFRGAPHVHVLGQHRRRPEREDERMTRGE